jgi:long-chain fatty acid transport protein
MRRGASSPNTVTAGSDDSRRSSPRSRRSTSTPGASFKARDNLALGFGVSFQRIEATFTNQVNYSGALLSAGVPAGSVPPGLESSVQIKGDDNAYGWNAGLLWEIDKDRRVGLHYRSSIRYDVSGEVTFTNPAVPPALAGAAAAVNNNVLFNSGVTAKVKLPPIFNLSYFGTIDNRWDVMADAQWTGWSTIKDLTFVRTNGSTLASTPENFKDSWKVAIGANYRYDSKWLFRGGLAYDLSPVETVYRMPRLPDNDRLWLTAGAQFRWDPKMQLDFGAGYIWSRKASINKSGDPPNVLANGLLNGEYEGRTSIVSAQLTYSF